MISLKNKVKLTVHWVLAAVHIPRPDLDLPLETKFA